ncbi:GIY-YIG nuclease family protein [Sphingopyxis indica]|uniref:GIY-YIG nuclease family protein n=1 Tax=Sphingopyxis indica TaxID=436663 RepID=UPI002938F748|nr:GIY-YIG nuclease family protein [Sphingopyxis indica]WOF43809.1 GIY-YIG nuclease family protein [Sphingopyxis indica]
MSVPFNRARPGHRNAILASILPKGADGPCIYFLGWAGGPIKIGYARNLGRRWQEIQIAAPYPISIWAAVKGDRRLEREYHHRFRAHRLRGEWFDRVPEIEAEMARLNKGTVNGHLVIVKSDENAKNAK